MNFITLFMLFFFFNLNLEISRVSAAVELLESVKQ